MAGRKRKEINEEARKKTAERVEALKEFLGVSYKGLADYLGNQVCESTLRNYVKCRSPMEHQTAKIFYEKTGVIPDYWLGFVDEKKWSEYWAALEAAESAGYDDYIKAEEEEKAALRAFFERCRFDYVDLSDDPQYMFGPHCDEGTHRLTRSDDPAMSAMFTSEELTALFSKLGAVVELEVYKKMKGRNHSE